YRAADFAFENKMDAQATEWLNESLKQKETMANLWLKARMQHRAGDKAAAIKTGEMALAKKTPQDSEDFAAFIRAEIDKWKK
ncbi:MAG TPA: hypothetical protein VFL80_11435, partial [Thermoanaerobaculia bacterium]|nr:hypothetical protein [Thermoanaerobaculia bacterium]